MEGLPVRRKTNLHGVGLAIKNTLQARLTETLVSISERLMTFRIPLDKSSFATILSAYVPTLPSESEVKDSFYQALDGAFRPTPKNDKIYLLADYNARAGQNIRIGSWSDWQAWSGPG